MQNTKGTVFFRVLMILQGLLWVYLCVQSIIQTTGFPVLITGFMMINGLCFLGLAFLRADQNRERILIVVFLTVNLILTVTDQMGLFDWIVLILNVASLTVLFFFLKKR